MYTLVILFILLFVILCVKINHGTHKGMHLVLPLKLGVTGYWAFDQFRAVSEWNRQNQMSKE
jgi:hypothetical protein